jgi:hypothetical protein
MSQTKELTVVQEWLAQYPGTLKNERAAGFVLAAYIKKNLESVVSVENLNKAAAACYDLLEFEPGKEAPKPKPVQQYSSGVQQTDEGRPETHAQREDRKAREKAERILEQANAEDGSVDAPSFIQKNAEAKKKFDYLLEHATVAYHGGRIDRGRTAMRREQIQALATNTRTRSRGKDGETRILYWGTTGALAKAEALVREFEKEDTRRNSR